MLPVCTAHSHDDGPQLQKQGSKSLVIRVLLFPVAVYNWLVCDKRPDVITHKTRDAEWQGLRSQWRWAHAVFVYLGAPSHILWRIKWPLAANLAVAGLAMYDALSLHTLLMVSSVNTAVTLTWRLSSFMLALLLAFKVNRVYDRWWMGRQAFAGVGNASYTLAQQAVVLVKDQQLQDELLRWCKVWHFSIYGLLHNQKTLHPRVAGLLDGEETAFYNKARKGRQLVVTRLRQLVNCAGLGAAELLQMDQIITKGVADQGVCARIMFQCMPYSLTLMCSGFLEIWLLLMPLGLFPDVPNTATATKLRHPAFELLLYLLICILMLGVDEVTSQLEQPFPHMPMLEIADTTVRDIERLKEEAATLTKLGAGRLQQPVRSLSCNGGCQLSNAAADASQDGVGEAHNGAADHQLADAVVLPMGP